MISRTQIETIIQEQGLYLLGVVPLEEEPEFPRFAQWLADGRHAAMNYLEQNLALREDPRRLFPGAINAVVVALPYGEQDASETGVDRPRIAQYARYRDYHRVMRRKCEVILTQLKAVVGDASAAGRAMVDSAPLLERALAARTSAGFIGKNTCYIHPRHGSFLLLAEIVVNFVLPTDAPAAVKPNERDSNVGGCGTCKRCQVHCPTGALDSDYRLDARRCLAYWTIEHRGFVPEEFWPWFGKYWFGCDICQVVCPYNRGSELPKTMTPKLPAHLSLYEVAVMDQSAYEQKFGGTPMTRAKCEGLKRNALIAMAVTKDEHLASALRHGEQSDSQVLRDTAAAIKARWL